MREKSQNEVAKTLETPVFSRGIEILTEKVQLQKEGSQNLKLFHDIFRQQIKYESLKLYLYKTKTKRC